MSRIPASASVTLAGLLPVCAAALGLGEVEPKSYLNQPLEAEIPVFSELPSEIAGLDVALASSDTFAQYGLQRPVFFGDLRFAVVQGPRGAVIRITSPEPVTDPFVTLLLDVRWPQGRLLREYTVLLDPPAFTGGAVRQPVQAPAAPTRAAEPVVRESAPVAEAPAVSSAPGAGTGTHTVVRNETLWGIADRYRPDSATDINQVMLAIYRANPEAFAGNINRLSAGAVLRLPDRGTVEGLGPDEAVAEVRRQNREWRGAARPAAAESTARLELVPPSETAPAATPPPPAGTSPVAKLQSEVDESRRLLAVRDAELQALRNRVAAMEKEGGGLEVEVAPGEVKPPAPAAAEEPAAAAPLARAPAAAPRQPAAKTAPAKPGPARPPAAQDRGIVGTILGLLTSIWLWVAAAVVLVAALLFARRRAVVEATPPWRPTTRRGGGDDEDTGETGTRRRVDEDMIVIEEPGRAQATGGFERRAVPRGDEESPLERTISTEGPVNLDQSDPLAEADFHMAYGLYDQAADLLTAALGREPSRRDLQLKLLDVYFVWENREGFLKEALTLRQRLGNDSDPDWKRVIIMGKQLCPTEAMFAGAAVPAADEMDLAFSDESGGSGDRSLRDSAGLDFDLSGEAGADFDSGTQAQIAPRWQPARTQEFPTIEAPGMDSASTMETPTIERPGLSSTLESPTIETGIGERTLETPTVETWSPEVGSTARLESFGGGEERSDQTEEIDLEDLGLDLTGLDAAARDMATGLQESLPDMEGEIDFDLSGGASSVTGGEESTAEMEKSPTLNHLARAMGRDAGAAGLGDDTAEQPGVAYGGATMSSPALSATSSDLDALNVELDLGSAAGAADLTATGLRVIRERRPEDPTMTEVGTKLDLARAYVDMGDPDGARSILNEVLEEGEPAQRQEARQLLDGLNS